MDHNSMNWLVCLHDFLEKDTTMSEDVIVERMVALQKILYEYEILKLPEYKPEHNLDEPSVSSGLKQARSKPY